jgi:chaperonin GroES
VLILRDPPETTSPGGLIDIPDNYLKINNTGIVVATGPGRYNRKKKRREPMEVTRGDRVVFKPLSGAFIEFRRGTLSLLSQEDIYAVLEDE